MAINTHDDTNQILEGGQAINGNVFTNDVTTPDTTSELVVKPGSLANANAGTVGDGNGVIQGKYGTLTLHSDGTYTYQLTKDMNYLGAGVDLHDEVFTYNAEYHDANGNDHSDSRQLKIDIHGTNDPSVPADVSVNVFEGGDHAGTATIYNGQFTLTDVNPAVTGVQTDLDTGDTHKFAVDNGTVTITSSDLTAAQIAAIKNTVSVALVDPNATDGSANFGKYKVDGDFDALSVGDKATITFEYWSEDTSTAGSTTAGAHKTATINVFGRNDTVEIRDDMITTYDQLIDGDIYKSILANDGHYNPVGSTTMANDIDVNDTLTIASTGYHDLDFYNNGGQISVDNAARTLAYTPGGGGAIAKDHFSFWYQATDGHTDPIDTALAEFEMVNNDGDDIDFYQFGGNGDDTICGIDGKNNVLSGMGGDDYLRGKEKGDILYGGAGDDQMHGGWGNDIYIAGKGTDGMVDTRGDDLYVFSKGDGRNTIDDMNLEIYTDAMGHETINHEFLDNEDVVLFDATVDKNKIAIFQEDGQYGSLKIKYSENADDCVSVGWQQEAHYGIETIKAADGTSLDATEIAALTQMIATYDLDGDATNGVQTAQNVQDVQNNAFLMGQIQAAFSN